MIGFSPDLNPLAQRYIKNWKTVQDEIRQSEYSEFFRQWSPNLLIRDMPLTIPELWQMMDQAWDETNIEKYEDLMIFYAHPIWWLNSKIEQTDEISVKHRLLAVKLASKFNPKKVMDRGGGYGLLARMAHELLPNAEIHLEDVISREAISKELWGLSRIHAVHTPQPPYDLIWSIEVFEHLPDPFVEARYINNLLKDDGILITSYSFYPMIKCHLPHNLYLHSVFHYIIPFLGFKLVGYERPGITVWIFQKVKSCSRMRLISVRTMLWLLRPFIGITNIINARFRHRR
ncbi:MAG: hypothetical protein DPW16_11195 [Chloroflexi bacterium]|nr:hypothetical protein [Chloroflexota bacterium]